jgi:drug/metabolite transporter (DMT)-like permease
MAICAYFFANSVQAIYRVHPDRLDTLSIDVFFMLLYLAGAVSGFFLLKRARWAGRVVSIVALLTVTASVMGLFAFFNVLPYSSGGIAFDIFALVSAGVLLLSRRHVLAYRRENNPNP